MSYQSEIDAMNRRRYNKIRRRHKWTSLQRDRDAYIASKKACDLR